MKKKSLLFLMVFISIINFSFCQAPFVKMTNISTSTSSIMVAEQGNDTSLVYFTEIGTFGKLNKTGIVSWYKKIQFPSYNFNCNDLIRISNTTFCAAGSYNSMPAMLVFNKNGVVSLAKSYTLLGYLSREVLMNNSRLLFIGLNPSGGAFSLMKTDISGNCIVAKKITLPLSTYSQSTNNIALAKVNSNLYLATVINRTSYLSQSDMTTVAVDSTLNILWSKTTGGINNDNPVFGVAVGNKYLLVSQTNSSGVGMIDMLITCMDTSGNILWNKTYGTPDKDELPRFVSVCNDSTLLISGSFKDSSGNETGMIAKIDENGQLIWTHSYLAPAGYKNMNIHRVFRTPSNLIRATFQAITISNNYVYDGLMDIKPSGATACLDSMVILTEKKLILDNYSYTPASTSISPVASTYSVTTSNPSNSLTTICNNSCLATADMHISATRICSGSSINLQNTSSNFTSIAWLIDGVYTGNSNSFSPAFNTSGIHQVSIVANNGICSDTLSVLVTVDSLPSSSFSFSQQLLEGYFTNLSAQDESDTWVMGDGSYIYSTYRNINHAFTGIGTYDPCLITSNSCGTDTFCNPFYAYDHSNFAFNSFYGDILDQEWGFAVCQNAKGEIIAAIQDVFGFDSEPNLGILKLNQNGKIIKQTMLSTLHWDEPSRIYSLNSRGYLILSQASVNPTGTNPGIGMYSILDTAFNSLTSSLSINPFYQNCAIQTKDLNIYIGGSTSIGTSSNALLLKTDKNLNKIWFKQLYACAVISGIALLNDGKLIVVGATATSGAYLAKIDTTTGSILWSKYYSTPPGMKAKDVFYDSFSNEMYIAGYVNYSGSGTHSRSFILKADTDGNILWKRIFEISDNVTGIRCYKNQFQQVFLCHPSNSSLDLITQLDTAGNVKWTKNYRLTASSSGWITTKDYALCCDGGIVSIGITNRGSGYDDAFVIKTDTSGANNLCNITYPILTEPSFAFTLNSIIDSTDDKTATITNPLLSEDPYIYPDSTICSGDTCSSYFSFGYSNLSSIYQFNFTPPSFEISNVNWNFGDGNNSTEISPVHTYINQGNYTVCLSVNTPGCGLLTFCDTLNNVITNINSMDESVYVIIYPNPALKTFTIEAPQKSVIEILNIQGQTIKTITSIEDHATIDISGFAYGMYFVKVKTEKGIVVKKFIKE